MSPGNVLSPLINSVFVITIKSRYKSIILISWRVFWPPFQLRRSGNPSRERAPAHTYKRSPRYTHTHTHRAHALVGTGAGAGAGVRTALSAIGQFEPDARNCANCASAPAAPESEQTASSASSSQPACVYRDARRTPCDVFLAGCAFETAGPEVCMNCACGCVQ